jgi:hypothetical protein
VAGQKKVEPRWEQARRKMQEQAWRKMHEQERKPTRHDLQQQREKD